ncbi:MAG: hypothetical protein IH984_04160 [Planctomycetes bacterium]|nr:hypothetical protein [Planctomycetota bacterium]
MSFMVVMLVCAAAVGSNNFPSITSDDFNKHIQQLSLDSAQKNKAKVIFDSYQEDLQATLKYRDQMLRWIWSNLPAQYGGYDPDLKTVVIKDERLVEITVQMDLRQLQRNYFKQLAGLDRSLIKPVESLRRKHLRIRMLQESSIPNPAPCGVAFDVAKLLQEIVPDWRSRPDVAEYLASYEELMDRLLIKLDHVRWRYDSEVNQGLRDLKAKLARGEILPDDLDGHVSRVADSFVEIHYLLTQIRTLNNSTTHVVVPLLSDQDALLLQIRARRYLASYLYDSSALLPYILIMRALKLPSLSIAQQETLSNLRISYLNKELISEASLEPKYEQMWTKHMYRLSFEAWVRRIILKETIEDPREQLRDEFNVKIKKWNALQEQFNQQLKVILTDSQWQKIQ